MVVRILCELIGSTETQHRVSPSKSLTQQPLAITVPPTRSNAWRTPTRSPLGARDATARPKTEFFALVDNKGARARSRNSADGCITESCGRKWETEWLDMEEEAKIPQRPKSWILGRKSKVTKYMFYCNVAEHQLRYRSQKTTVVGPQGRIRSTRYLTTT